MKEQAVPANLNQRDVANALTLMPPIKAEL